MEKVLNKIYEWIDKIGKHNFMLIVFILIVTIVTSLYTTFSIMTSTGPSELIDGLLTYKFILTQDSDTNSVTIAANSSKLLDITVSNEEKTKLQYGIYYTSSNDLSNINIGYTNTSTYPSTGLIEEQSNYVVTIKVDNKSEKDVTINFGLVFGLEKGGDLIYPEGSNLIDKYIEYGNAAKFVKSLYEDGSSINTVNIGGNTSKPKVHLNETQSIMLDNNGDYRYYGANPNNYVEYNGELWRIISSGTVYSSEEDTVGEQRVRIMRDDFIGYHAWNANGILDWTTATLNTTLNESYYNGTKGVCYKDDTPKLNLFEVDIEHYAKESECDYENGEIKGLSNESRNLIDDAVWYLGKDNIWDMYVDEWYNLEKTKKYTDTVGIINSSDYGYSVDLNVCKGSVDVNSSCDSWLHKELGEWLLSAWVINDNSCNFCYDHSGIEFSAGVRPVVVLKSDVEIISGKGTNSNPYKLSLEVSDSIEETEEPEVAEYGELATTYIHDLYTDGSTKNKVTIGTGNQTVKQNTSKGIMYINQGDTYGEEYRYYGASPNNYVDFNGELWRIISSSKVFSSTEDTTGETRVRIIKDTSIGKYAWDNDDYTNNWADATLMCQLNTMYYNDTVPACTGKSLTNLTTSLNAEARSLIDNALWYLGGGSDSDLYADDCYIMERGTTIADPSYPYRWTGKLGLMYPSDYLYATDLSLCKLTGYNYIDRDSWKPDPNCVGADWLFNGDYQWLMSPKSDGSNNAWFVDESGYVDGTDGYGVDDSGLGVRPLAVLKSDVTITGGEGTDEVPYTLGLNS